MLVVGCGRVNFEPLETAFEVLPRVPTRIAAGGQTSCLRRPADVVCWGLGASGHLGDGNPASHTSDVPRTVMGTGPLVELDVNDGGELGRTSDGTVVGWGPNSAGSLASGNTGPQLVAVPMLGIANPVAVAVAFDAMCVVEEDGGVACAGKNLRLGDGSTLDRGSLGPVPLDSVVQLSGGDSNFCALHRDGRVSCWGDNTLGQLGDGTFASNLLPSAGPVGPYTTIAVGDAHTCGLTPDGTVDCWGDNGSGQVGDGTTTATAVPIRVPDVEDATALLLTAETSCALHRDGGVSCWGGNRNGELTIDLTTVFRARAERISLTDVVELSGRTALHACAIKRDHTIWCWGSNKFSQLGRPETGAEPTPLQVPGLLAE